MTRIVNDEKGQAFPLALIALAVGALLITPFLDGVSTNALASRQYGASIVEQYAADAGIEDAIWKVTYDGVVISPGNMISYALDESVNGITPHISITRLSGGGGGPGGGQGGGPGGGQGGGQGGGTPGKTYEIVASAGDTTIQATMNELAGAVSILSWQRN